MSEFITLNDSKDNSQINIEIEVQDSSWQPKLNFIKEQLILVSRKIFSQLNLVKYAKNIEFSIILTDNAAIQKINLQFLNKDKPTNVLSFPLMEIEPNKFENLQIHDEFVILGDIIFANEVIKSEAEEFNISFEDHFTHLLVHGILHILGYDHLLETEAVIMENLEIDILNSFNIKSPY